MGIVLKRYDPWCYFALHSLSPGIFRDSNNIFLWHESEDINQKKKKIISKISFDSNFTFTSYAWLSLALLQRLLCLIGLVDETLGENALISLSNFFLFNSFGEMCFLEESYKMVQKIQILKFLRARL